MLKLVWGRASIGFASAETGVDSRNVMYGKLKLVILLINNWDSVML